MYKGTLLFTFYGSSSRFNLSSVTCLERKIILGLCIMEWWIYYMFCRLMLVMTDHRQLLQLKFLMLFRRSPSKLLRRSSSEWTRRQSVWLVLIFKLNLFIVCAHDKIQLHFL